MSLMQMSRGIGGKAGWWRGLTLGWSVGLVTIAAPAQSAPARFTVTQAQVLVAMQAAQLPVPGVEVKIAARISTLVSDPLLEVQSMSLLSPHSAHIRISCHNHTDCLPFYAVATWPDGSQMPSIPAALSRQSATTKDALLSDRGPTARVATGDHGAPGKIGEDGAKAGPTLRTGARAMLLLEEGRIHIRVKVVCLESGATGDKVRVATPDRKQAYVAEILTPTTLKGSL